MLEKAKDLFQLIAFMRNFYLYIFTILWISVLVSWIPFTHTTFFVISKFFQNCSFFTLLNNNFDTISSLLSLLLLFQFIFFCLAFIPARHNFYEDIFKNIFDFLTSTIFIFSLLCQLAKNLSLINFGICDFLLIAFDKKLLISTIYGSDLLLLCLIIIGYFYRTDK